MKTSFIILIMSIILAAVSIIQCNKFIMLISIIWLCIALIKEEIERRVK